MYLKDFLIETAQTIRDIEAKAKSCLGTEYSKEYDELMRQKAHILLNLADRAREQDSKNIKNIKEILKTLQQFSKSAEMSLSLNSSWYMSALLYPEDYKDGAPNNLEKLIAEIREA